MTKVNVRKRVSADLMSTGHHLIELIPREKGNRPWECNRFRAVLAALLRILFVKDLWAHEKARCRRKLIEYLGSA
jgi:hypothetical protein